MRLRRQDRMQAGWRKHAPASLQARTRASGKRGAASAHERLALHRSPAGAGRADTAAGRANWAGSGLAEAVAGQSRA